MSNKTPLVYEKRISARVNPDRQDGKNNPHELKRELKLMDATLLVIGSMIGSGIFIVAADMTRNVGSAGWLISVWVITGVMTLIAPFGYPYLPAAYVIMGLAFCTLLIIYKPNFTWGGLIIVLLGLPIYYLKDKSWKFRH